jgi:hypothetical protein
VVSSGGHGTEPSSSIKRVISWHAEDPLAYQERLCCLELLRNRARQWLLHLLTTWPGLVSVSRKLLQTTNSWHAATLLPKAIWLLCIISCISDSSTRIRYDSLRIFITSLNSFTFIYILNCVRCDVKLLCYFAVFRNIIQIKVHLSSGVGQ